MIADQASDTERLCMCPRERRHDCETEHTSVFIWRVTADVRGRWVKPNVLHDDERGIGGGRVGLARFNNGISAAHGFEAGYEGCVDFCIKLVDKHVRIIVWRVGLGKFGGPCYDLLP